MCLWSQFLQCRWYDRLRHRVDTADALVQQLNVELQPVFHPVMHIQYIHRRIFATQKNNPNQARLYGVALWHCARAPRPALNTTVTRGAIFF